MTGHISYSSKSFKGSTERHMQSLRRAPANKAMVFRFDGKVFTISECMEITGMTEEGFRMRLRTLKKSSSRSGRPFNLSDFKA